MASSPAAKTASSSAAPKPRGRPRKLRTGLSFHDLSPASRPQPEEVACLVHQYLVRHFPGVAVSFRAAASSAMAAFAPLLEHAALPLEDALAELVSLKQKEADEAAVVALLGSSSAEESKRAGDGEGEDAITATYSAMQHLLKDYAVHRAQAVQVSSVLVDHTPTALTSR